MHSPILKRSVRGMFRYVGAFHEAYFNGLISNFVDIFRIMI